MQEVISDIIVGALVGVFALLGLVLAANARDQEMLIFGFGLVVFGVLFIFGRVTAHLGRRRAAASHAGHHHG